MSKDTKSKSLKKLIDINRLQEFKNKLVGTGSAYVQTAAVDQTIAGTKTFSKPIVGSVTGSSGSCTGNAATATKLQTACTINGTSFDGTANITTANWGTARNISITDGTNTSTAASVNGSANVSLTLPATIKANLTGNASTATTATTAQACTGNSATATKATQDSAGQQINTTYIKGLAVSGRTITYTKGDGSTGTITTQDTNTWTAFKGATSSANGTAGYVPAPTKGNQAKFFKADGTWATPPNTTYASMSVSEATTGTATAARTISAKVLHDKINSNLSAYSKNGHTHDDRYYTENEVNNLLNGKANTSGTYSNLTVGNAGSATNATYAKWLRTSSHSDHLFHTEWDHAGYFWTYVTTGDGTYRAVRVARSDSAANADCAASAKQADHATSADSATQDSAGQQINTTYIKGLAVSGRTITYTKGDGSTGTITTQDTNTWTAFKGATSSANGTAGYVPAPTKGNQAKFFKADGTWATPPNTTYASMSVSEATTGTATAARTISAKVLHDKINSNLSAYSKNGHTHDDRYYTENEVNNLLNGKANTSGTYSKLTVGSATRATQDSDGNRISTTYVKRTDVQNFNVGASFIGFYSSVSRINGVGNGGRLTVGATTSASNLYDTITANIDTVVCSRNIALAGTWKLMSIIKRAITSSINFIDIEATRGPGSSYQAGVVASQGLFVRVS